MTPEEPSTADSSIMFMRIALIVLGLAMLAIGAYALFSQVDLATMPNLILWLVAGLVIHDAIAMPIVAVVGVLLTRGLPSGPRQLIQGGLIVAAVVSLIALPVVIGGGRTPANPSLLPLDYSRNLVIVLALIGLVVGLLIAGLLLRNRFASNEAGSEG